MAACAAELGIGSLRRGRARLSRRAADGEALDEQGRLADADRDALALLAAGADAGIEGEVVADHCYPGQHVGAIADERGALDRGPHLAVLDEIGLGRREHELAR